LTFTLTCLGLPTEASCSFTPNPVTPGPPPNGTTVQLLFETISAGLSARPLNWNPRPWGTLGVFGAPAALLAAGVIQSRQTPGCRLAFGVGLAAATLATALTGYGDSSSSGSAYTETPKGPATFTVSATAGTMTISTQRTATVQ
jgi:hypothetical protein